MSLSKKQIIAIVLAVVVIIIIVVGMFFKYKKHTTKPPLVPEIVIVEEEPKAVPLLKTETIGNSVDGRKIEMYTFGKGPIHLAFIGGIHGGYEWNSVLLSYKVIDYLTAHPNVVPPNLTIFVIPSANPDGIYKVTGKEGRFTVDNVTTDKQILASARFNSNEVDLNRNFDCMWQPKSTWQTKIVNAGTAPFSEPEAEAIKKFVYDKSPNAVVLWHSQADGVFASKCKSGILPETLQIMNTYSKASGYPAVKTFGAYAVTGAADDWLSSINIPAITVELKTHQTIEWEQNLAGILSLIDYYKNR